MSERPALVVCMGVSGCGKSTVAAAVAAATGLEFFEADEFHSEENRARMASGLPLDDAMREPWIDSMCQALSHEGENGRSCVLACSALRRAHRQRFRETGLRTLFLFLEGDRELIAGWMAAREGHFMPATLLDSQFEALESPLDEPDVVRIGLDTGWGTVTETAMRAARDFLTQ